MFIKSTTGNTEISLGSDMCSPILMINPDGIPPFEDTRGLESRWIRIKDWEII
jgi:hypothetical protein